MGIALARRVHCIIELHLVASPTVVVVEISGDKERPVIRSDDGFLERLSALGFWRAPDEHDTPCQLRRQALKHPGGTVAKNDYTSEREWAGGQSLIF